ncbi:MAG: polyphosphate polymerase domain-containing protein [Clostridia bacterium]
MAKEVFSRYEVKYMLNTDQKETMVAALREYMNEDRYNYGGKFYTISNIYYDTEDNTLIQRSLSKPQYKEKLRLRGYGIPKPGDIVFLEIKKKFKGIVNKRRSCIELEEAKRYMETGQLPDFKPYMNKQVLQEIDYFTHIYDLKPKLYLAYDRLAFFDKNDSQFRVSFDTNIRTRRHDLTLDAGDYGQKMLKDDIWLMEVKINKNLPLWFARLLQENKMYNSSFSKYGTEYARMVASGRMENADSIYSSII